MAEITITIPDEKAPILAQAMQDMGAKRYRMDKPVDPISITGNTPIQQAKAMIVEFLKGVVKETTEDKADREALVKKNAVSVDGIAE